jgi:hypothetical protein
MAWRDPGLPGEGRVTVELQVILPDESATMKPRRLVELSHESASPSQVSAPPAAVRCGLTLRPRCP